MEEISSLEKRHMELVENTKLRIYEIMMHLVGFGSDDLKLMNLLTNVISSLSQLVGSFHTIIATKNSRIQFLEKEISNLKSQLTKSKFRDILSRTNNSKQENL